MKHHHLRLSNLKEWLDLLSESHEGQIKLINLFYCHEQKLVSQNIIRSFISDSISLKVTIPEVAISNFDLVCGKNDDYFALISVKPSSMKGALILSTIYNSYVFHRYILGRPKTMVKSVLPPEPNSHDTYDEQQYCDAIAKITLEKNWFKETGSLGKPFPDPRHVWFTYESELKKVVKADSSPFNKATKTRDALGLIETRDNTYLLSIQFLSNELSKLKYLRMARPGFADQGNRRFAIYLDNAPKTIYKNIWGLTVHLGKLNSLRPKDINGVPERICSAIPLTDIGDKIKVEPIGWVIGDRGENVGMDDDSTFIKHLCSSYTFDTIKDKLITFADKP